MQVSTNLPHLKQSNITNEQVPLSFRYNYVDRYKLAEEITIRVKIIYSVKPRPKHVWKQNSKKQFLKQLLLSNKDYLTILTFVILSFILEIKCPIFDHNILLKSLDVVQNVQSIALLAKLIFFC